jgi:YD repeat-containing protein
LRPFGRYLLRTRRSSPVPARSPCRELHPGRPPWQSHGSQRVTSRTHDDFDRSSPRRSISNGGQATISYTYWNNGLRKTATDARGRITFYECNSRNLLSRVRSTRACPASRPRPQYWPDNLLKAIRRPNGTATAYVRPADRVLTIVVTKDATPRPGYGYDDNGNRTRQVEENGSPPETTLYEYDGLNRLTAVTYPGKSVTYGYDAVGNRVSETERDAMATWSRTRWRLHAINRLGTVTDRWTPPATRPSATTATATS